MTNQINLEYIAYLFIVLSIQEMVDWFNAIRAARFHYLQVAYPGASISDVSHSHRFTPSFTHLHSFIHTPSLVYLYHNRLIVSLMCFPSWYHS